MKNTPEFSREVHEELAARVDTQHRAAPLSGFTIRTVLGAALEESPAFSLRVKEDRRRDKRGYSGYDRRRAISS